MHRTVIGSPAFHWYIWMHWWSDIFKHNLYNNPGTEVTCNLNLNCSRNRIFLSLNNIKCIYQYLPTMVFQSAQVTKAFYTIMSDLNEVPSERSKDSGVQCWFSVVPLVCISPDSLNLLVVVNWRWWSLNFLQLTSIIFQTVGLFAFTVLTKWWKTRPILLVNDWACQGCPLSYLVVIRSPVPNKPV